MKSNVSFFRRIGSISYDLFLVFSFVFFIAGIIILINNKEPITNPFFFFLVTLPVIYSYFSISWVKGKQTLGMRAWKFEIIQEDGFLNLSKAKVAAINGLDAYAIAKNNTRFEYQRPKNINSMK